MKMVGKKHSTVNSKMETTAWVVAVGFNTLAFLFNKKQIPCECDIESSEPGGGNLSPREAIGS